MSYCGHAWTGGLLTDVEKKSPFSIKKPIITLTSFVTISYSGWERIPSPPDVWASVICPVNVTNLFSQATSYKKSHKKDNYAVQNQAIDCVLRCHYDDNQKTPKHTKWLSLPPPAPLPLSQDPDLGSCSAGPTGLMHLRCFASSSIWMIHS